MCAIPAPLV